ncbi:MAG: amino acid adenylation domain-containing protein [Candidatus Rickettsiella isopodorum]
MSSYDVENLVFSKDININNKILILHSAFEKIVDTNKNSIAILAGNNSLSYKELDDYANRLSHYLLKTFKNKPKTVGICLKPSIQYVVAQLAILKIGAAFVPLDSTDFSYRTLDIINKAEIDLLISSEEFTSQFNLNQSNNTFSLVLLDKIEKLLEQESILRPALTMTGKELAYIMFTSGSTGAPKGVEVEHNSVINCLFGVIDRLKLNSKDKFLGITNLTFDVSIAEIFIPLMLGGTIEIISRDMARNAIALRQLIEVSKPTILIATPTTWRMLLISGWEGNPKLIICSTGEALSGLLAEELLSKCRELWNLYGPTESTIWACAYKVNKGCGVVPIGLPLPGIQIYIDNKEIDSLKPSNFKQGELFIGGKGLARSYKGQQKLTEEKFFSYYFEQHGKIRFYKSGDLVKINSNNELEYLGRKDDQLKINGIRMEPAEIEKTIESHPTILHAIVVAYHGEKISHLVAYLMTVDNQPIQKDILLSYLSTRLPIYMIPKRFIMISEIPKTAAGKLDKSKLPTPTLHNIGSHFSAKSEIEIILIGFLKKLLEIEDICVNDNFFDLGVNSLLLIELCVQLKNTFNIALTPLILFEYSTIRQLAVYLDNVKKADHSSRLELNEQPSIVNDSMAIIGMACRFPGAPDINEFWNNLKNGKDSIQRKVGDKKIHDNTVWASAKLNNVEEFDFNFFGMSKKEAELMDPQHRLFLECAWDALENSGYTSSTFIGRIGVISGSSVSTYLLNVLQDNLSLKNDTFLHSTEGIQIRLGNFPDYLPMRVSYKLNLTGPSFNIQSACSSSLVAIHLAKQMLISGDCDMVIVGAASILIPQSDHYLYDKNLMLSHDGVCRAFDAKSTGTVFGSGCGVVVLRRLDEAAKSGDHIWGSIIGTAINNDGSKKLGFTAPGLAGQVQVVKAAIKNANIDASTIQYIEAHGTGTPLGDPLELEALNRAFNNSGLASCGIGSVKTNVGHLVETAGMAGLIKTVLGLYYRKMPASLNCNSYIQNNTPFYVNNIYKEWPENQSGTRRAGLSSFGFGGTNTHIILESTPESHVLNDQKNFKPLIFTVSAKTKTALIEYVHSYIDFIIKNDCASLEDIAFTANLGRKHFNERIAIVSETKQDLLAKLQALSRKFPSNKCDLAMENKNTKPIIFKIQNIISLSYIQSDFISYPKSFHESLKVCLEIYKNFTGINYILENSKHSYVLDKVNNKILKFALQYSLSKMWMALGILPTWIDGKGIGALVAVVLTEIIPLKQGIRYLLDSLKDKDLPQNYFQNIDFQTPIFSINIKEVIKYFGNLHKPFLKYVTHSNQELLQGENSTTFTTIEIFPDSQNYVDCNSILTSNSREANSHLYNLLNSIVDLYEQGFEIKWLEIYNETTVAKRIPLPSYPYERKRCWVDSYIYMAGNPLSNSRPYRFAAQQIDTPSPVKYFQLRIGPTEKGMDFLLDHQVSDQIVLPMTAYIEIILATTRPARKDHGLTIEDFSLIKPIVFYNKDHVLTLQLELTYEEIDSRGTFRFYTKNSGKEEKWVFHAKGVFKYIAENIPQYEILAQEAESININNMYIRWEAQGLKFGKNFRIVDKIWKDNRYIMGTLSLQRLLNDNSYEFHPAALDACIHIFMECVPGDLDWIFMHGFVRHCSFYKEANGELLSKVRFEQEKSSNGTYNFVVYVEIYDINGYLIAHLESVLKNSNKNTQNLVYDLTWISAPLPLVNSRLLKNTLIVSQDGGFTAALSKLLLEKNILFEAVEFNGGSFKKKLIAAIGHLTKDRNSISIIINIPQIEESNISSYSDLTVKQIINLVNLINILLKNQLQSDIYFIAIDVPGIKPEIKQPNASSILALKRVIDLEMPNLVCNFINLDSSLSFFQLSKLLLAELTNAAAKDEIYYVGSVRYSNRLTPFKNNLIKPCSKEAILLNSVSSYLITGGTGAIGMAITNWLIRRGAKKIILTSRAKKWSTEGQKEISALSHHYDAHVIFISGDISCKKSAASIIGECEKLGPLTGIFHAAGIVSDGLLRNELSVSKMQEVMKPKIYGAWNLHELTLNKKLDYFVFFSSSTSVLGAAGQFSYAVSNGFMDGLANYRASKKLPALSINWGPWSGGGMFSHLSPMHKKSIIGKGINTISPITACKILESFLKLTVNQVLAISIDWRIWCAHLDPFQPKYSLLIDKENLNSTDSSPNEKDFDHTSEDISEVVLSIVLDVLGETDRTKVRPSCNLFDLGMDSLMTIDIASRLNKKFDMEIFSNDFFTYTNIQNLSNHIKNLILDSKTKINEIIIKPQNKYSSIITKMFSHEGGPNLFLLPGVLGDILSLGALGKHLGSWASVYGLSSYGLHENVKPYYDMESIVEHYVNNLHSIQKEDPYFLIGHSFGGKVAYAIAQRLLKFGRNIGFLGILDIPTTPYHQERYIADWADEDWILSILKAYLGSFKTNAEIDLVQFKNCNLKKGTKLLREFLVTCGIPISESELNRKIQVYKGNVTAYVNYICSPLSLNIPCVLYRASETGSIDFLPDETSSLQDKTWGWSKLINELLLEFVPGDHFSMIHERTNLKLAESIKGKMKSVVSLKEFS